MRTDIIYCIDPATRKLGWAVFRRGNRLTYSDKEGMGCVSGWALEDSGWTHAPKAVEGDWVKNVDAQVADVRAFADERLCQNNHGWNVAVKVLIELPSVWAGGGRGEGASNSGSIMKLAGLVFAVRQALLLEGYSVELIPVTQWKGSVPKAVTAKRVRAHWGCTDVTENNELDAIGIGDWYIRKSGKLS